MFHNIRIPMPDLSKTCNTGGPCLLAKKRLFDFVDRGLDDDAAGLYPNATTP